MSNNAPEGWLVILGDPVVGETLTARPNAVTDADGINQNTVSYQWLRDGEPILGATSKTYKLTSQDAGSEITLEYMYRDNRGNNESVISRSELSVQKTAYVNTTPYVAPNRDDGKSENPNNTEPTGWVNILGDAEVGETLTARPNAIVDVDGIRYETATFQWFREDELIKGATSQTYVVTAADQGKRISVEYAYMDKGGTYEIEYSKPKPTVPFVDGSEPVDPTPPAEPKTPDVPDTSSDEPTPPAAPVTPTPTPVIADAPVGHVNSGPVGNVFILGFPLEGTDLLARLDALFDRDTIVEGTGRFQWLRDGEPIPGATEKIYTITSDDRGAILSVQYSYTDGYGTVETVVSDPETPVPFPEGEGPTGGSDVEDDAPAPVVGDSIDRSAEPNTTGVLAGTPRDDELIATVEFGRIDGLAGTDTAVFAGDQSNYVVMFTPDGVTVTDRTTDGLGTIMLDNVELIDFDTELPVFGDAMSLTQFGGHTGLDADAFEAFIEMYIAYFNRAPDAVGLAFWGTAYANGMSLEEIANEFATQPETLALYPADASNIKFVSDVYQNVLGRAPDIDGLRFWTDALNEGGTSRGEFILSMLNGVQDGSADRAYLDQKTDLGAYFSVHRGMSNTDDATQVMALFDGSTGSVQTAVDAIDALYNASMDPENGDFLMPLVGVLDDPFSV